MDRKCNKSNSGSGDVRDWRTRTDQPPQQTGSKHSDSWEQQSSKTVAPQAPSAVGEVGGTKRPPRISFLGIIPVYPYVASGSYDSFSLIQRTPPRLRRLLMLAERHTAQELSFHQRRRYESSI